jgi:uracil-DNA glycosylase family 4
MSQQTLLLPPGGKVTVSNSKKASCPYDCPLYERPKVESEVQQNPLVWFVGEAPGYDEVRQGRPFTGKAGKLLRKTLSDLNFNVPKIITNACLCHPDKNKTPSIKAIQSCQWHFDALPKPEMIVAMGIPAAKALGIPVKKLEDIRGKVFLTRYGPCLVTYHPSRILRSQYKLKHVFVFDLKKALAILRGHIKLETVLNPDQEIQNIRNSITILDTEKDIIYFLNSVPVDTRIAIDIETALPDENGNWPEWGLNRFHPHFGIYVMGIAYNNPAGGSEIAVSFPVEIKYPENKRDLLKGNPENIKNALRRFFETHRTLIAHNAKFEYAVLKQELGINPHFLADTQLMAYVARENMQGFYSLETLSGFYNIPFDFKKIKSQDIFLYNALDTLVTLKLYHLLRTELANLPERVHLAKAHNFLLHIVTPLLVELENRGVLINKEELKQTSFNLDNALKAIQNNLYRLTGVSNPKSKQFREYFKALCEDNGIELEQTESGLPSIKGSVLQEVFGKTRDNTLKKIILYALTYNKLSKLYDSYVKTYPEHINPITGRIHPNYKHTGTETGRLSCEDPNFQQIPKGALNICPQCYTLVHQGECDFCHSKPVEVASISKLFTAPEGYYIISADYSQMEVRVLAHVSRDENLIKAIRKGLDLHSYTVSQVYDIPYNEVLEKKDSDPHIKSLRDNMKRVVFGIIYGITPAGLARQLKTDPQEAQKMIDEFYKLYPGVKRFFEEVEEFVKKHHYYATITHRVRHFDLFDDKELREARNFPIQSAASDLALHGAYLLMNALKKKGLNAYLVGHIHDAVKIEAHKSCLDRVLSLIKKTMTKNIEKLYNLAVPLEVDCKVETNQSNTIENDFTGYEIPSMDPAWQEEILFI